MRKKIILGIILLCYLLLIFYFSHNPGEESKASSDVIVNVVTSITKKTENVDLISLFVRKSAHFIIYAGLSLVIFFNLKEYMKNIAGISILSIVFTFVYACSDEFHQTFISERSGEFTDVILDTTGAIVMIVILYLIFRKKYEV